MKGKGEEGWRGNRRGRDEGGRWKEGGRRGRRMEKKERSGRGGRGNRRRWKGGKGGVMGGILKHS